MGEDGGPGGRFGAYWGRYNEAELTPSGRARRDTLAALVPRLAIAERCEVSDRFLIVRGDRHTYHIHCGSGNIMIMPDRRYVCIVPAASAAPRVFLPFEGDAVLSLILSKAFLLAADHKITDPSIISQL
jgi:hypothetical protein